MWIYSSQNQEKRVAKRVSFPSRCASKKHLWRYRKIREGCCQRQYRCYSASLRWCRHRHRIQFLVNLSRFIAASSLYWRHRFRRSHSGMTDSCELTKKDAIYLYSKAMKGINHATGKGDGKVGTQLDWKWMQSKPICSLTSLSSSTA